MVFNHESLMACRPGGDVNSREGRRARAETRTEHIELPVNPELGRPEHHEWRWTSFDEARELLAPRLRFIVDWAESVAIGPSASIGDGE